MLYFPSSALSILELIPYIDLPYSICLHVVKVHKPNKFRV